MDEDIPQDKGYYYDQPEEGDNFSDLEQPTIKTTSTYVPPKGQKKFRIPAGLIGALVFIVVVAAVLALVPKMMKAKDITAYKNQTKDQLAASLGVTFEENEGYLANIFNPGHEGTYKIYTNPSNNAKHIGVIEYEGKQVGLLIDDSKYSIFGMRVGDMESDLVKQALENHNVVTDQGSYGVKESGEYIPNGGMIRSSVYLLYGTDGSLIVLKCNNASHRVACIEYYPDGTFFSDVLSSF